MSRTSRMTTSSIIQHPDATAADSLKEQRLARSLPSNTRYILLLLLYPTRYILLPIFSCPEYELFCIRFDGQNKTLAPINQRSGRLNFAYFRILRSAELSFQKHALNISPSERTNGRQLSIIIATGVLPSRSNIPIFCSVLVRSCSSNCS